MTSRQLVITGCCLFISACSSDMAPETTPPWSVYDFTVRTAPDGYHFRWTATGDDGNTGRASQYDLRYFAGDLKANWGVAQRATDLPKPNNPGQPDSVTVTGIGDGPFQFGIKVADDQGNLSAISNVVTASVDVIPPAAITDLSVRSTFQAFYFHWTAPFDNGTSGKATHYEIRYASSNLAANWDTSPVAPNAVVPATAGQPDSATVLGIGIGPWEMGIKSIDASGNWSALSNVVTTTIPEDAAPPSPVTDLSIDMITEGSVVLRWTASGDDGSSGQASAYDIRFAQVPITIDTWASATKAPGPVPRPSGDTELFAIPGLQSGETYYLALRVLDEAEHLSEISNSVTAFVSVPVQLTFDMDRGASRPDWSPDGEHIAYAGTWYTQPNPLQVIDVIPASGGAPVRYTSSEAADPSWSRDGTQFVFSLYVDDGARSVIALMNTTPEAPSQILIDPGVRFAWSGNWSPDGGSIAYVTGNRFIGEPPVADLYRIPSAGGSPEHLYGGWDVGAPDWSPDGNQIVFYSNEAGTYDLWIMPATGGSATQLTTYAGTESNPAWSSDGNKIAFVRDDQIWILYLTETYLTQVTFDPTKKVRGRMTWSPDGTKLAFGALKDGPNHPVVNIWTIAIH